jgi:mono/diheme cytochrome c family protein
LLPIVRELHTLSLNGVPKIPPVTRATLILSVAALGASAYQRGVVASELQKDVLQVLETYCFGCHDGTARGGVNLEALSAKGTFWSEPKTWERTLNTVRDASMPPAKKPQPTPEERARVTAWLSATLDNPDPLLVPSDVGRKLIHRLSRLEYNNTVRDLLGVESLPADRFPPDGGGGGGFDNNASTLFVPPILMEKYLAAATDIVAAAKPELIFHVRPGAGKDEHSAAAENLTWLAQRAFRRPVPPEELAPLLALHTASLEQGVSWAEAMRQCVRVLLVSPSFLFRVEQDRPGIQPQRISDWELASRLSYFLWSSMPDESLFALAKDGKLSDPAVLEAQVNRMVSDSKARIFSENFASQWLRTKELRTSVRPANDKFPEFTPALRDAMAAEPVEFFHALLRENRPLTDCIDADYTYVNAELAKFYGLGEVQGDGFRRVAIADQYRGGVLTMAGVLTLTSFPRRSSPVLRGKWMMEEILGTPPPPPPPMIKVLPTQEKTRKGLTLRQQLEVHRSRAECAACHRTMDQLGFALENFGPIGAWRTTVADVPVDSSGELPDGSKFTGPVELKRLLLERKDEFTRNVAERMFSYALGRGVEQTDWLTIRQIARAVANDGYGTRRLVLEIARSRPFQFRKPAEIQVTAAIP